MCIMSLTTLNKILGYSSCTHLNIGYWPWLGACTPSWSWFLPIPAGAWWCAPVAICCLFLSLGWWWSSQPDHPQWPSLPLNCCHVDHRILQLHREWAGAGDASCCAIEQKEKYHSMDQSIVLIVNWWNKAMKQMTDSLHIYLFEYVGT